LNGISRVAELRTNVLVSEPSIWAAWALFTKSSRLGDAFLELGDGVSGGPNRLRHSDNWGRRVPHGCDLTDLTASGNMSG